METYVAGSQGGSLGGQVLGFVVGGTVLGVLLGLGASRVVSKAIANLEPPPPPTAFVLRPRFSTTEGDTEAGTAFLVSVKGFEHPVLLTALHLLGPAGGLPTDVPAADVGDVVKSVEVSDAFEEYEVGSATEAIVIPSASESNKSPGAGDVLALWMGGSTATTRRLAAKNPGVGDPVWLAAKLVGGSSGALHRGVVEEIDGQGGMWYRFDVRGIELRATSGAPVLNSANEVVGINIGGSMDGSGPVYGWANAVDNFREPLLEAMRRSR